MVLDRITKIFKPGLRQRSADSLPDDVVSAYEDSRTVRNKKYLCHAPFNNMYFNSLGDVANCWLTFDNPERYDESRTIKEIWTGEKFSQLRKYIEAHELDKRCGTCSYYIKNGNFVTPLAKAYDNNYPLTDYPSIMEFELSNLCNLECTMCTGLLSSSIRAKRDKLPPLKSPYGAKFVEELKEFIPHLHEARFNGGEPFIIPIYYDIWEQIFRLNPSLKITVATNGTALNTRTKEFLQKGNFHINLSIDSLRPESYKEIRVNSDLGKVLEHFEFFKDYCHSKKRSLCIMINPMRNNWEEMPDFVNFCNEHNVQLWFNSIINPESLAIWNLPLAELETIYDTLSNVDFKKPAQVSSGFFNYNVRTYKNLVESQIRNWRDDARKKANLYQEGSKTPVEDPKEVFLKKLDQHLCEVHSSAPMREKARAEMLDKIARVESLLVLSPGSEAIYATIGKGPVDVVVQHFTEYSDAELAEKIAPYINK